MLRHAEKIKGTLDNWQCYYEPQSIDKYKRYKSWNLQSQRNTPKRSEPRRPDTKWFNRDPAVQG